MVQRDSQQARSARAVCMLSWAMGVWVQRDRQGGDFDIRPCGLLG